MLPDIQKSRPDLPLRLNRVGARNIKKLVLVDREDRRPVVLVSNFEVFVDLTRNLKGANLSRNFEAVDEVIEELTKKPVKWIEELTRKIAEELLRRHEYASKAEVNMNAELILRKRTPVSNKSTQEVVKIFSSSSVRRMGKEDTWIGVEVWGTTACPCAQELMKARITERLKKKGFDSNINDILDCIVFPTHNQRGKSEVWIQLRDYRISLEKLIEIAKAGMSCEIYELLKREDEAEVVERSHKNPLFVEDSVRRMAEKAVCLLRDAPPESLVILRQENEESIHQHNVFAEIITSIGELRNAIEF
ncbi:MAG: GTP cyclohydrolase I FolE2 [Archaeoglobus sp.]|nr:MAG: GTP cyclohydrolase I FolE2 [Archaeoglobus sp.]